MAEASRAPGSLDDALAALRPLLLDLDGLVRAVAAGRRRGLDPPPWQRAELRPVDLKSGPHLQVVTSDGLTPTTRNHAPGADAEAAVTALLAEPFGNWHVETRERTVQLRVTKRGAAQVHSTSPEVVGGPDGHEAGSVPAVRRHDRDKAHLLDPGDRLFDVLGAGADKRRQVDAFLRQLQTVVPEPPADRPLHVVDLGCGNAYLTFAAHRYLTQSMGPIRTVGVDVRADMVERNRRLADRLGAIGLEFVVSSIEEVGVAGPVDLVLALHACDTATDDALATAAARGAGAVLAAPCCHHDLHRQLGARRRAGSTPPAPYAALVGEAILRQRFADVLTDTLRAQLMRLIGYRVDVVEFIDSRHTPRNAMLRMRRDPRGTGAQAGAAADLVGLCADWKVRPYLLDALGDLVESAVRQRIGPRP